MTMSELSNRVDGIAKPAILRADPGNPVDHEARDAVKRRKGRASASIARIREKLGDDI